MSRKRQDIWVGLLVGIFLAFGVTGTVLATDEAGQDSGVLPISAPWGSANQDPSGTLNVVVTYEVKFSPNIPTGAVNAVHAGIAAWNLAINGREGSWAFDLVPFVSTSAATSGAGPPSFLHNPNAPPGHGGGGGGGDDTGNGKADIQIQLKKGGGLIAGLTRSTIDADGFRVGASIQISGGFIGIPSEAVTITEITMHELGHALSLGHHSNEADLMGPSLPSEGFISTCDLDGFVAAHHWLTEDLNTVPHLNHASSVMCP